MGDYGTIEVALLVERPAVGLGVALVVGGASAEGVRSRAGVPVEEPLRPDGGLVRRCELGRSPGPVVDSIFHPANVPAEARGAVPGAGCSSSRCDVRLLNP